MKKLNLLATFILAASLAAYCGKKEEAKEQPKEEPKQEEAMQEKAAPEKPSLPPASSKKYMAELGCCTWTESPDADVDGNVIDYNFTTKNMIVNMNGNKMEYTIVRIDDSKRSFILYAKGSKKYVPIFWEPGDGSFIQITRVVKEKAYDSLYAAGMASRTAPWWKLVKK